MRKCVGNIELLGKKLKYYVFGSHRTGFGVEITEIHIERANQIVSTSLEKAISVAQTLQKCSVFPTNLDEIVEDMNFWENSD